MKKQILYSLLLLSPLVFSHSVFCMNDMRPIPNRSRYSPPQFNDSQIINIKENGYFEQVPVWGGTAKANKWSLEIPIIGLFGIAWKKEIWSMEEHYGPHIISGGASSISEKYCLKTKLFLGACGLGFGYLLYKVLKK